MAPQIISIYNLPVAMADKSNGNTITQTDPLILALDTSTKVTSMALARGERIVASFGVETEEKRSERLWAEIDFLFGEAGFSIKDVSLFSVCVGPGGFTGLRVGIAAIKGFAAATARPVVGVTSLETAAFAARPARRVCALVGAYKGEVYSQLFTFDEAGIPVAEDEPAVTRAPEAVERLAHFDDLVFAGDAVNASMEEIHRRADSSQISFRPDLRPSPKFLADHIAQLAFLKFSQGDTETAETLRACYVRPSEAEVKLSLGLLGSKVKREAGRE